MQSINETPFFRDVFLSHASVDKEKFIKPFVELLEQRDITYWLDEAELKWGQSLLDQLSTGLTKSKFVIVFLSDDFLSRNWPQAELRIALNEEISTGQLKVLPLLICDPEKCLKLHPFLRDKKYLTWDDNILTMVSELEEALGRSYNTKWEFTHPPEFRGHVWLKIMPKAEHKKDIHKFSINWGRWEYKGKLDFQEDNAIILSFRKIAEEKSWPIHLKISPSAFVVSGRGDPVIDINKGWVCKDRKGLGKTLLNRRMQSFLPDKHDGHAKLIE